MDEASSSETYVTNYEVARRHIPDDWQLSKAGGYLKHHKFNGK